MASLIQRPGSSLYYIQFYLSGKLKRRSTGTESSQIAKEKLRQFESAQARGEALPLPTTTPIADVLSAYVSHIRLVKRPKSAQTDIYYLRDAFGPVCDALKMTSRMVSEKAKKRPPKPGQDRRRKPAVIQANCFEHITTADIAEFIRSRMENRGLAAKTGNRYREILTRLFNWAMSQHNIHMPNDKNPAASVERFKEPHPVITFLTLQQIDDQLDALADDVRMQAAVAILIFAGLRREELLWLTWDDVDWKFGNHGKIRVRAKNIEGEAWQPKTCGSNRGVPVSSRLRPYLDKLRLKGSPGLWVIPNSKGRRCDPDNFSSDLRTLNADEGLEWSNLDYRHTFGSQLAMKGESLYKIAKLMGNSPDICRKHYAALLDESLTDSVEFTQSPPEQLQSAISA